MTTRLLMAGTVAGASLLTDNVKRLRVVPRHRRSFPSFQAGDHVQLQVADGIRRDYSLCNDPSDPTFYEVAVQREPNGRGGSALVHEHLHVGDEVFISYPQPGMRLVDGASRYLFIAGGIGVTAILGLLQGIDDASRAEVHYCVASRSHAPLYYELLATGAQVTLHVSDEGTRLDVEPLLRDVGVGTHLYHCGPPRLMEAIQAATTHWSSNTVHCEEFVTSAAKDEYQGPEFTATLAAAKKTFTVGERSNLLTEILGAGVPLEFSCEGGICGTCIVEVAQGSVDHRDSCLTDTDRTKGFMAACVSRGVGDITILL